MANCATKNATNFVCVTCSESGPRAYRVADPTDDVCKRCDAIMNAFNNDPELLRRAAAYWEAGGRCNG